MFAALIAAALAPAAEPAKPKSARDALQPFNVLVGSWRATGTPEGTQAERQKGFWKETIAVGWKFHKGKAALTFGFENGKHFAAGELTYLSDKDAFQLTVTTPSKDNLTFTGVLTTGKQKEQVLTLDRTDPAGKEDQRLVVTLLHNNRFLYRLETKPSGGGTVYTRKYQVGATKEGEDFASVAKGPECVVSGGLGKTAVTHNGKTYYVCCSGCRDAFKEDPEKWIKEYEAKLKEKK
jgi:ribosomal protein L24E